MSTLESDLRKVWDKYESQRAAEREAVTTRLNAAKELADLNERRARAGLSSVSEYATNPGITGQVVGYYPPPKTWRDEMYAELLRTIGRHFT